MISVENSGYFITEDEYNRLLKLKLNLIKPCEYCESIKNATKKSPRKKYKYCPMCSRSLKGE